jgi:hypothetical protein
MWVKAREREKNKEKCVNRAMFLTSHQVRFVKSVLYQTKLVGFETGIYTQHSP